MAFFTFFFFALFLMRLKFAFSTSSRVAHLSICTDRTSHRPASFCFFDICDNAIIS